MDLFLNRGGESEDFALVKSLRKGKFDQAYRKLFDKYHQKIFRVSLAMGLTKEDAEGIVQEVFMVVWEKRQTLNESLSFNAFLLTLTKRFVIKKLRYQLVSNSYQKKVVRQSQAYHTETEHEIIFQDLENYALSCIHTLPPARKEILLLSKNEGLSNDEIALKLGISKRTVENQLYRAIKCVKQHLEKESDLPSTVVGVAVALIIL